MLPDATRYIVVLIGDFKNIPEGSGFFLIKTEEMLTREQEEQFQQIFEELGKSLDITEAQYNAAVKSYENVGNWLGREESPLAPYRPEISPQGSFLLGTSIRPVHEDDDFDVDLVLRLNGKPFHWTQQTLKQAVGQELREHGTFARMLKAEGRRCWTLQHAEDAHFHLDILPAISRAGFSQIKDKLMSVAEMEAAADLVFGITDRTTANYSTSTNSLEWPQSNPFGYAIWFEDRATVRLRELRSIMASIKPVPAYQSLKTPLQRIVQIWKRHRDIMFNGDEDKPISIILTTLAAQVYRKEMNILDGLVNGLNQFTDYVETRYDARRGRMVKWIANPVNPAENFADKWPEHPEREQKFYKWLAQAKKDIANVTEQRGMHRIQQGLSAPFGEKAVNRAFSAIGGQALLERESGGLRMAAGTGMLGAMGRTPVIQHNNFGANE
jgi:hypothetical protein